MKFNMLFNRKLIFGAGSLKDTERLLLEVEDLAGKDQPNILLISGRSVSKTDKWKSFVVSFEGIFSGNIYKEIVHGEPSPEIVDEITEKYAGYEIDIVIGIGGGSVMDTGKAVSAMIPLQNNRVGIKDYLEGVGKLKPPGIKLPYIAIPTTSGTGSEATKNAVISRRGKSGFKKSLRHDKYVPDIAIIDPEFMLNCPRNVTAFSGMDTISQLIESYISTKANPITDALAMEGLRFAKQSFTGVCGERADDVDSRAKMALASYISGVTLAHAGLGTIHGIAGPAGGFFDIPHGVVCANLLPEVLDITIERLKAENPNSRSLKKLGNLGYLFSKGRDVSVEDSWAETIEERYRIYKGSRLLVEVLREWLDSLDIPRLSIYGITESDVKVIAENSDNKNNPIRLTAKEIESALLRRI